jgi:hypothetical protein
MLMIKKALVDLGGQRPGKGLRKVKDTRLGWHPGGGNMAADRVPQSNPQREALPLHAAA